MGSLRLGGARRVHPQSLCRPWSLCRPRSARAVERQGGSIDLSGWSSHASQEVFGELSALRWSVFGFAQGLHVLAERPSRPGTNSQSGALHRLAGTTASRERSSIKPRDHFCRPGSPGFAPRLGARRRMMPVRSDPAARALAAITDIGASVRHRHPPAPLARGAGGRRTIRLAAKPRVRPCVCRHRFRHPEPNDEDQSQRCGGNADEPDRTAEISGHKAEECSAE